MYYKLGKYLDDHQTLTFFLACIGMIFVAYTFYHAFRILFKKESYSKKSSAIFLGLIIFTVFLVSEEYYNSKKIEIIEKTMKVSRVGEILWSSNMAEQPLPDHRCLTLYRPMPGTITREIKAGFCYKKKFEESPEIFQTFMETMKESLEKTFKEE